MTGAFVGTCWVEIRAGWGAGGKSGRPRGNLGGCFVLEEFVKRFKVVEAHQNGKLLHRLSWLKPGATWTLDDFEGARLEANEPQADWQPVVVDAALPLYHGSRAWDPILDCWGEKRVALAKVVEQEVLRLRKIDRHHTRQIEAAQ